MHTVDFLGNGGHIGGDRLYLRDGNEVIYIFMFVNMFMESQFELFKALGDRTRYNLVSVLINGERCACELPGLVKRAQPTVSLQLKYLLEAGVLSSRRDGKKVLYRIADGRTERFLRSAGME